MSADEKAAKEPVNPLELSPTSGGTSEAISRMGAASLALTTVQKTRNDCEARSRYDRYMAHEIELGGVRVGSPLRNRISLCARQRLVSLGVANDTL
jgi:hypothetical protein